MCVEPLPQAGSAGGGGINCCAKIISNKPFLCVKKLLEIFRSLNTFDEAEHKMPKI
jgi:hypothetical protein